MTERAIFVILVVFMVNICCWFPYVSCYRQHNRWPGSQ